MTFSVSLKLLTKNFQNGIKSIQNSLGRLRQQFSTFVGGIGIGLGIQELIENANKIICKNNYKILLTKWNECGLIK